MHYTSPALALESRRHLYFAHFNAWTTARVTTALALVNNLTGAIAIQQEALVRQDGRWRVRGRALNHLASLARMGAADAVLALSATMTCIDKYWSGVASTRAATLRKIGDELQALGLFEVRTSGWRPGTRQARQYQRVRLHALLVAHEQLEEVLVRRGVEVTVRETAEPAGYRAPNDLTEQFLAEMPKPNAPSLPSHNGYWGKMLFDRVFEGVAQYRRALQSSNVVEGVDDTFEQLWGLYDTDALPQPAPRPLVDSEALCRRPQRLLDRFGATVLAAVERVCEEHPEWQLWVDNGCVVWVPF